jgi:hypothetical protein
LQIVKQRLKQFLDDLCELFYPFAEVQESASDFVESVAEKAVGLVSVLFLFHRLAVLVLPDADFKAGPVGAGDRR